MSLLGYVEKKKPAIYDVVQGSTANPAIRQGCPGCYNQTDRHGASNTSYNYSQSMQGMDARQINPYADSMPPDFNVANGTSSNVFGAGGHSAAGGHFSIPGNQFGPSGSPFASPGGQFIVPGSPFAGGNGGQHGMSNGQYSSRPPCTCVPQHRRP
jgi:hypothetical protein